MPLPRPACLFAAVLLAVMATGCVRLAKDFPERREYLLAVERTGPAREAPGDGTALAVQPFRVSPAFAGRQFVVQTGPNRFEPDYYHLFLVPPERNITEAAAAWLGEAGLFDRVTAGAGVAPPTHALEGRVVRIDGEYGAAPRARLTLQVSLVALRGDAPAVVLHRTYEETAALPAGTPEALADGWNRTLAAALTRLEADMAESLGR